MSHEAVDPARTPRVTRQTASGVGGMAIRRTPSGGPDLPESMARDAAQISGAVRGKGLTNRLADRFGAVN